jgi:hypothetical protein
MSSISIGGPGAAAESTARSQRSGRRFFKPPPSPNARARNLCAIRHLRIHDRFRQAERGNIRECSLVSLTNKQCVFLKELEAPPGFEPGMEVLQTGPGRLSC